MRKKPLRPSVCIDSPSISFLWALCACVRKRGGAQNYGCFNFLFPVSVEVMVRVEVPCALIGCNGCRCSLFSSRCFGPLSWHALCFLYLKRRVYGVLLGGHETDNQGSTPLAYGLVQRRIYALYREQLRGMDALGDSFPFLRLSVL